MVTFAVRPLAAKITGTEAMDCASSAIAVEMLNEVFAAGLVVGIAFGARWSVASNMIIAAVAAKSSVR
jgi:hypothetical protein